MKTILAGLLVLATASSGGPFEGRWNFNIVTPGGARAAWLGITEKGGQLEVQYQPTGGNVFQLKDVKVEGGKLILGMGQMSWELEAQGDKLVGVQRRGERALELVGHRAPALNRPMPRRWGKPVPLFNGKDLTGWEPIGDPTKSQWTVESGLLVNKALGPNLKSTGKYQDFKLHFEVNCPPHANSGFYLRGRYEIQIEYGDGKSPAERSMGSIYGRIAPQGNVPPTPGQWESFDVTLVGRTLTVVRSGVTIIDAKELEGITGGALDANEAEPGPFYIQGDHAGGLKFRNITLALPE